MTMTFTGTKTCPFCYCNHAIYHGHWSLKFYMPAMLLKNPFPFYIEIEILWHCCWWGLGLVSEVCSGVGTLSRVIDFPPPFLFHLDFHSNWPQPSLSDDHLWTRPRLSSVWGEERDSNEGCDMNCGDSYIYMRRIWLTSTMPMVGYHVVSCPTRWSLSLLFGFLWWSSVSAPR